MPMDKVDYTDPVIVEIAGKAINRAIDKVIDPERIAMIELAEMFGIDTTELRIDDKPDDDKIKTNFSATCKQLAATLDSIVYPDINIDSLLIDSNRRHGKNLIYLSEGTKEDEILKNKVEDTIIGTSVLEYEAALKHDFLLYFLKLNTTKDCLTNLVNNPEYLTYIADKKSKVSSYSYIMSKVIDFFDQSQEFSAMQFLEKPWDNISLEEWTEVKDKFAARVGMLDTIWSDAIKEQKEYTERKKKKNITN